MNHIFKTETEDLSMENKAREFLKSFCKCDENCNIDYKPYECGAVVESIPFKKALEKFISDFEEMKEFLSGYGISDEMKVFESTCKIWKEHIVVFK